MERCDVQRGIILQSCVPVIVVRTSRTYAQILCPVMGRQKAVKIHTSKRARWPIFWPAIRHVYGTGKGSSRAGTVGLPRQDGKYVGGLGRQAGNKGTWRRVPASPRKLIAYWPPCGVRPYDFRTLAPAIVIVIVIVMQLSDHSATLRDWSDVL
eukprot:COSAG06_NODE_92_length_24690_cov_4.684071_20_plen_153_part_00